MTFRKRTGTGCYLALLGAALVGLQGCAAAFGLPSIEEQSAAIKANITSTSRIAVGTSASLGTKDLDRLGLAPYVVEQIAEITRDKLGAEVVALDQSEDGDWAKALREGTEDDYVRAQGFDAYLEVVFGESGWGGVLGSATNIFGHWEYEPGFWIYMVNGPDLREMIKYTHRRATLVCAVEGRKIFNYGNEYELIDPEACAQEIVDTYRRELIVTLAN